MPYINCYECGNQISTKGSFCPHCGAPPIVEDEVQANGLTSEEVPPPIPTSIISLENRVPINIIPSVISNTLQVPPIPPLCDHPQKTKIGRKQLIYIFVILGFVSAVANYSWPRKPDHYKNVPDHQHFDTDGNPMPTPSVESSPTSDSSDTNNPNELVKLGYQYLNAEGVCKDYDKAASYFNKAAAQGDKVAQYELGMCYFTGDGVKQNLANADTLFIASAGQDFSKSKNMLIEINEIECSQLKNSLSKTFKGNNQEIFCGGHPFGTAKSVAIHEVSIKWKGEYPGTNFDDIKEFTVILTLFWEGPFTKDGYTKLSLSYDGESKGITSTQILATNGSSNEDFNKGVINYCVGFIQGYLEKQQHN